MDVCSMRIVVSLMYGITYDTLADTAIWVGPGYRCFWCPKPKIHDEDDRGAKEEAEKNYRLLFPERS